MKTLSLIFLLSAQTLFAQNFDVFKLLASNAKSIVTVEVLSIGKPVAYGWSADSRTAFCRITSSFKGDLRSSSIIGVNLLLTTPIKTEDATDVEQESVPMQVGTAYVLFLDEETNASKGEYKSKTYKVYSLTDKRCGIHLWSPALVADVERILKE